MIKGTTFHAYLPIMLEPDHRSQMVSQLIFGEEFTMLGKEGAWLSISLDFDGTEGWVVKQGVKMKEAEIGEKKGVRRPLSLVALPSVTILDLTVGQHRILPAGAIWNSDLGEPLDWYGHQFEAMSREGFLKPGPKNNLQEIGKRMVSLPHMPGGRSGFGFDGPGLVQFLCRMIGKQIPRTCQLQSELGTNINFMNEVEEGDLAFFDNEENEIVHVGMILRDGNILHSDTCVSIDLLDHHGIYSNEQERYTHKLRVIKRI
jgi:hypothetical protein